MTGKKGKAREERCCAYCAEHRDYDTACTLRAAMIGLHQIDSQAMCCPLFKPMKFKAGGG